MKLSEILQRNMSPTAWQEGEHIPWDDLAFSERILREHLSQESDAASRPDAKIKKHVRWIHKNLLHGTPSKVLDLGCGPGLYTAYLAQMGHDCTGIDFAPAAIHYAQQNAPQNCRYTLADIRSAEYGSDYDLIIYIFGALNLVPPQDARLILKKIAGSLKAGGILLLEASSMDAVDQIGNQPAMWYSAEKGLFSDSAHLCLMESFWDEEEKAAIERFYIVNTASGQVTSHSATTQAYTDEELEALLKQSGLRSIEWYSSLSGDDDDENYEFSILTAKKPAPKKSGLA